MIVPTRNAPPTLGRTLAHLANQTLPPNLYEVIVVTGGVVDEVWRLAPAGQMEPAAAPTLRVLSQPGQGAARRRNAGAAAARGDLLVFLDDDMAAEPGLLQAHLQAHARGTSERVVMGYLPPRLRKYRHERALTWVEVDLRDWWEDTFRAMTRPGHRFRYTDLMSGNFSLPKALFVRVGGFNADLFCREDFELGARLLAAGGDFALMHGSTVGAPGRNRSGAQPAAQGRRRAC